VSGVGYLNDAEEALDAARTDLELFAGLMASAATSAERICGFTARVLQDVEGDMATHAMATAASITEGCAGLARMAEGLAETLGEYLGRLNSAAGNGE